MRRSGVQFALVAGALASALMSACGITPSHEDDTPGDTTNSASSQAQCGREYLDGLDQRDRLAQLLIVGVTGETDATEVVSKHHVGGIFLGSWTDAGFFDEDRISGVQEASETELMVGIDEEGGRVSRLKDLFGSIPSARRSAQTMSSDEVRSMARKRGGQMADLGITVDFAPVVDVSGQPDTGAIGDRSYSDDPATVAKYATAFANGLQDADLLPVIKHFPGHGHAEGDSHTQLVQTPPLESLLDDDLVPYQEMIGHLDLGVMIGHLDVPDLTESGQPASLSSAAVDLLRSGHDGEWDRFDGVIFTDDLSEMKAISDRYTVPEAVEHALDAGADLALWQEASEVPDVLDRLETAIDDGELDSDSVDRSVLRVARAKGIIDCTPTDD